MTALRVILVCAVTALGEVGLIVATTADWAAFVPMGLVVVAFLLGPPAFLAMLAWRRRAHPRWPRRFLALAGVVAAVGLGVLGWDTYRYHTDPAFRLTPNMDGVIVPLVQWVLVLAVWLVVVVREGREKRAAAV